MKFLALSLVTLLSAPAFANDGGVVGVLIKDLKIEQSERVTTNTEDQVIRTPIDLKENQTIEVSFNGDLSELFKYLPGQRSVIKQTGRHIRALAFPAKEGSVSIVCEDADLSFSQKGKAIFTPKTPKCTISISKYAEPVADDLVTDLFGDFQELRVPRACRLK